MTPIDKLQSLLDWKLLKGSHMWPGPDGGTCINEAAIVAAGFEYRAVSSSHSCPPCFCPVISQYLLTLNDVLPDEERQKLMRFVLRLAGSKDETAEAQRLDFIVIETVRRITAAALKASYLPLWAAACRTARNSNEARDVAMRAMAPAQKAWAARHAWATRFSRTQEALSASSAVWAFQTPFSMHSAADAVHEVTRARSAAEARAGWAQWAAEAGERVELGEAIRSASAIVDMSIEIIEGALAIGRQAPPIDTNAAAARMAEVKQRIREAV